tara:strand:- start:458 stop:685 length:228 start_codon:yes stop_codon:yes gene_type:complete
MNIGHKINNMNKNEKTMKAELDEIATNVADVINEHINNSISWAVDGTFVDKLSNDYFCEAIEDIKALVIKKLKNY